MEKRFCGVQIQMTKLQLMYIHVNNFLNFLLHLSCIQQENH